MGRKTRGGGGVIFEAGRRNASRLCPREAIGEEKAVARPLRKDLVGDRIGGQGRDTQKPPLEKNFLSQGRKSGGGGDRQTLGAAIRGRGETESGEENSAEKLAGKGKKGRENKRKEGGKSCTVPGGCSTGRPHGSGRRPMATGVVGVRPCASTAMGLAKKKKHTKQLGRRTRTGERGKKLREGLRVSSLRGRRHHRDVVWHRGGGGGGGKKREVKF